MLICETQLRSVSKETSTPFVLASDYSGRTRRPSSLGAGSFSAGSTDGSSLDGGLGRLERQLPQAPAERRVHNTFVDFEAGPASLLPRRVQICGDLYTCRPRGHFEEIQPIDPTLSPSIL